MGRGEAGRQVQVQVEHPAPEERTPRSPALMPKPGAHTLSVHPGVWMGARGAQRGGAPRLSLLWGPWVQPDLPRASRLSSRISAPLGLRGAGCQRLGGVPCREGFVAGWRGVTWHLVRVQRKSSPLSPEKRQRNRKTIKLFFWGGVTELLWGAQRSTDKCLAHVGKARGVYEKEGRGDDII